MVLTINMRLEHRFKKPSLDKSTKNKQINLPVNRYFSKKTYKKLASV